jgi:hypothetical protein
MMGLTHAIPIVLNVKSSCLELFYFLFNEISRKSYLVFLYKLILFGTLLEF